MIRPLATALHLGPDSPLLMLKVYFDDSGEQEQTIGGCLAHEETWESIDAAWKAALDDARLVWFHAVAFEDGRHQDYAHLSRADRDALFERLLGVLTDRIKIAPGFTKPPGAYVCIASVDAVEILTALSEEDWEENRRGRGQPQSSGEKWVEQVVDFEHDPYCACLATCFRTVLDECGAGREHPIHVFVADQPKRRWKIDWVYALARSNARWSDLLAGLSNGPHMDPRVVRPLQVADFVAYYLSKSRRRFDNARAARAAEALQPSFIRYAQVSQFTADWLSG